MNISPINNNINHQNFKGSVVKNEIFDEIIFRMKQSIPSTSSDNYKKAREHVSVLNYILNETPKEDVFEFYATPVEKGYPDICLLHNGKEILSQYAGVGNIGWAGECLLSRFGKENKIPIKKQTETEKELKKVTERYEDVGTVIAWEGPDKKLEEKHQELWHQCKVLQKQVDKELIADIEQVSKQLGY